MPEELYLRRFRRQCPTLAQCKRKTCEKIYLQCLASALWLQPLHWRAWSLCPAGASGRAGCPKGAGRGLSWGGTGSLSINPGDWLAFKGRNKVLLKQMTKLSFSCFAPQHLLQGVPASFDVLKIKGSYWKVSPGPSKPLISSPRRSGKTDSWVWPWFHNFLINTIASEAAGAQG